MTTSSYATKWYITLFANVVPFKTQLRLWDALFLEGRDILIVMSLAVIWGFRGRSPFWFRNLARTQLNPLVPSRASLRTLCASDGDIREHSIHPFVLHHRRGRRPLTSLGQKGDEEAGPEGQDEGVEGRVEGRMWGAVMRLVAPRAFFRGSEHFLSFS